MHNLAMYIQGCQLKGVSRGKAVVMNIAYTYFGDKLQTFPGLLGNVYIPKCDPVVLKCILFFLLENIGWFKSQFSQHNLHIFFMKSWENQGHDLGAQLKGCDMYSNTKILYM